MKVQKTYNQLRIFDAVGVKYLVRTGHFKLAEEVDGKPVNAHYTEAAPTPMSAAIKNVFKNQMVKVFAELNNEIESIEELNAATDPVKKTMLVLVPGNPQKGEKHQYEYTAAGRKKMRDEITALFEKSIDLHQRVVPDWESYNLTDEEKEAFSGIVIPEQPKVDEDADANAAGE